MPSKYYQRIFVHNHHYHIFNRGAYKQKTFLDPKDYKTFTNILHHYLTNPTGIPYSRCTQTDTTTHNKPKSYPVKLLAYCLMSNHFHLMLKQNSPSTNKNNITNLMRRLTITYAMYFTEKYHHSGSLFQGKYKNVLVDNEQQFIYLTKYIHRNPLKHTGSEPAKLTNYPYSSYLNYLNKINQPWIQPQEILSLFSQSNPSLTYQAFVEEKPSDQEKLAIKHLILDN